MKATALVLEDSFIAEEYSIRKIKNSIGLFYIADDFSILKSIILWFGNRKMQKALDDSLEKIDAIYNSIIDLDDQQLAYIKPKLETILNITISFTKNLEQIEPARKEIIAKLNKLIEKLQISLEMVEINLDNELINNINMALAEHE